MSRIRTATVTRCVCAAALVALALAGSRVPAGEPAPRTVLLDTHYRWAAHLTMLTPVIRGEDGALVPVANGAFGRRTRILAFASEPPPDSWMQPDFDDGAWPRAPGPYPLLAAYSFGSTGHAHHFALFCLRGTFLVQDPVRAEGITLSLSYRGGAVIYLNGKELARGHMPEGKVSFDTPALDYPPETYVDSKGRLVPADFRCGKSKDHKERAALRTRRIEDIPIPVSALRKGVNVLAVALHRAPMSHAYAPASRGKEGFWTQLGFFGLSLSAPQGAPVTPGGSPPEKIRVFNALPRMSLHNLDRFDPWEPLRPVELTACRNAGASGQVVVCSPGSIRGVAGRVSDLERKDGGNPAVIPASAVEIRYAVAGPGPDGLESKRYPDRRGKHTNLRKQLRRYDALEEDAPAEVPVPPGADAAMVPVWVTINVPKGAAAGRYEGTLRVSAEGMAETAIPVRLEVWHVAVPDRDAQASYAGIVQSPDTVAINYKVERWSEKHWNLITRSFRQLGRLGGDCVIVPLVRQTFYGNEESMVRWVREPGGAFRHDLSIFEKYLDCAVKESGPPRIVCLCLWEPVNAYSDPGPEGKGMKMEVTVVDRSGKPIENAPVPSWGTPECRQFWKPVFEDIRKALAARGLDGSMCAGSAAQACPGKAVFEDMEVISPGIKWFALRHEWWEEMGGRETAVSVGVYGDPGRVGPGRKYAYSWQDPRLWAVWPRTSVCNVRETSCPLFYHVFMNRVMIAGTSGIGNIGADFWPVAQAGSGRPRSVVRGNWVQLTMGGWGTPSRLIAPGAKGPIGTVRLEMLREGIQDAEIRVLIEKALVNEKTDAAWREKARTLLDRYRTEILIAHPGGGKGFGGTFNDSFTWYAYALPGQKRALYGVAASLP